MLFSFSDNAIGQDIHFSQFYFSPLTLNPAHTGFFNGKHRFSTNYKTQWKRAAGGDPYTTFTGGYDVHILDKMMKAADMAGFGISFFSDKAGKGDLKTTGAFGSLAYHRDMTGNGKQLVSFGVQAGVVQMGFDRSKLRFGDEILSEIETGSGQEQFDKTSIIYADVNAGLLWNYIYSKKMIFFVGLSTYHLTRPKVNFLTTTESNVLSNRTAIQAGGSFTITKMWDVLPSFLYMIQKASNEANLGLAVRYNTKSEAAIRLGAWYRQWSNSDAFIIMAGFEYMDITLGMSYDINVSTLKETSNGQGSFEIALIYVLQSSKAIVQDMACPHF